MGKKNLLATLILSGLVSGCASTAVTEGALTQRTSLALGLSPDQFSISNRVDGGVRTDYSVQTHAGKTYTCYVTGVVSVTGRMVSDAICSEMNSGSPRQASTPGMACNALLQAAGKCH